MTLVESGHSRTANIVLVVGSLQAGGAERQLADMANYWASKGLDVTLATCSAPSVQDFYPLDDRVRRIHLDVDRTGFDFLSGIRSNRQRILKLRRLLSSTRPDAVLSFLTETNVLTVLAAAGLGVRVVIAERIQPAAHATLALQWRVLRRILYARSDSIVAQTKDAAGWIRRNCWKQAAVIPNALRQLPTISTEREPLIVAVGRLVQQKGFDLLLHAFARIAPDFKDWNLAIIGEGNERASLLRLRDRLALAKRAEFIGQSPDVLKWMARAGIVVQPSRFEGFPNALLEAMGMGAAVISTDCPSGPADLIENGINGRLVPVDDISALAHAMRELMGQPDIRERLGWEARKVRERFRQDLIMPQWEAFLLPAPRAPGARDGTVPQGPQ